MQTEYKPLNPVNSSWTLFLCQQTRAAQKQGYTAAWQPAVEAIVLAPAFDAYRQFSAVVQKGSWQLMNLYQKKTVPPENEWKVIAMHTKRAAVHLGGLALLGLCIPAKWNRKWIGIPVWPLAALVPTLVVSVQERLLGRFELDYAEKPAPKAAPIVKQSQQTDGDGKKSESGLKRRPIGKLPVKKPAGK